MAGKQYLATQEIFNKVFQNNTGVLKGKFNSMQDCLNAVYDAEKDALRIRFDGSSMMQAVSVVEDLPVGAEDGAICPVVKNDGSIQFYKMENGSWTALRFDGVSGSGGGAGLTSDQQVALSWLVDNLNKVQEVTSSDYFVKQEIITLSPDTANPIVMSIQGEEQNIDDDGNRDGDAATHYRIDISGYVLSVENYSNEEATATDRYYTKITYEAMSGATGISRIYLEKEEYDYFSSLTEGKNILKIFYMANVFNGKSSVSKEQIAFPTQEAIPTLLDGNGNMLNVQNGEPATHYRIDIPGYVLNIEGYYSDDDVEPQRFMTKMSYDVENNVTSVYFTAEEYVTVSGLQNSKNEVNIFFLSQK